MVVILHYRSLDRSERHCLRRGIHLDLECRVDHSRVESNSGRWNDDLTNRWSQPLAAVMSTF